MEVALFSAEVLAIEPHPDQATRHPGYWAVQFRVARAGEARTFWRWHQVRKLNENGAWLYPGDDPPTADEVLERFWRDTFDELNGFNFMDIRNTGASSRESEGNA